MVRCITCNVFHMRQCGIFFNCLTWFDTVEFNRLPCLNNKMHDDAVFADWFRYQLTMFGIRVLKWVFRLLHAHIDLWNRYCQNHRSITLNFLLFAWYDIVEFNRRSCPYNKIYDDAVFVDCFWYQLTMLLVFILIGLFRLLDTNVAYEIAI